MWLDELVCEYLGTLTGPKGNSEIRRFYSLIQAVGICSKPEDVIKMAGDIETYLKDGPRGNAPVALVLKG
jgi:hypothetical protein